MTNLVFTLLVAAGSFLAGLLGALTGLGGGVVIVPMLVLLFGVDLHYAIGASLVSVIATSSGAAAAFVREGYSNVRLGMFLEIATTIGAVLGAFLAEIAPTSVISVVFGAVLIGTACFSGREPQPVASAPVSGGTPSLRLDSEYPTPAGLQKYHVERIPLGFGLMLVAGVLSGLLGIGSGALKVLAMDHALRLPFKVSTTTSNFMIGVTAAASAGVYLNRGYIAPELAMPVMLGVLAGSLAGARILVAAHPRLLRWLFVGVVAVLGSQMIYKGFTGGQRCPHLTMSGLTNTLRPWSAGCCSSG